MVGVFEERNWRRRASVPLLQTIQRPFFVDAEATGALNHPMGNLTGGLISGLIFGAITVAMMLPMQFPDKPIALLAAFISRFGIGLVIGCVSLAWPGWLVGVVFGLLLSVPSALITKAYAPILVIGTIGGAVIGGILHGWK
jgi:hypothetical protein